MLDGLFDNALRVTPAGARIVLAVRDAHRAAAVAEVRDGGPGLTDADLAVAFEQGVAATSATAACARSAPGSGWPSCTGSCSGWAAPSRPATHTKEAHGSPCASPSA